MYYCGNIEFRGQEYEVEAWYSYEPAEYIGLDYGTYKVYDEGVELEDWITKPELPAEFEEEFFDLVADAALEDYHDMCDAENW